MTETPKEQQHASDLIRRAKECIIFLGMDGSEAYNQLAELITYEGQEHCFVGFSQYLGEVTRTIEDLEHKKFHSDRRKATSRYVGEVGQRIEIEARVVFTKTFQNETEDYERHLTILEDLDGNVIKYWNVIRYPNPSPDPAEVFDLPKVQAIRGDRIKFKAGVKEHKLYKEVRETTIERVTKAEQA